MKQRLFAGLVAGMIATATAPLSAQDMVPGAPPMPDPSAGGWFPAEGSFASQDLGERLDIVRRHYTGKLIRFRLAAMLATQETAIGIRADQKEAWRNYTDALLALVPEREALIGLIGAEDEDPKGPPAFARSEAVADALTAYAAKAETLKRAIVALRAVLTPQQLEAARVPRLARG